jgi:hypothetical protein
MENFGIVQLFNSEGYEDSLYAYNKNDYSEIGAIMIVQQAFSEANEKEGDDIYEDAEIILEQKGVFRIFALGAYTNAV